MCSREQLLFLCCSRLLESITKITRARRSVHNIFYIIKVKEGNNVVVIFYSLFWGEMIIAPPFLPNISESNNEISNIVNNNNYYYCWSFQRLCIFYSWFCLIFNPFTNQTPGSERQAKPCQRVLLVNWGCPWVPEEWMG